MSAGLVSLARRLSCRPPLLDVTLSFATAFFGRSDLFATFGFGVKGAAGGGVDDVAAGGEPTPRSPSAWPSLLSNSFSA